MTGMKGGLSASKAARRARLGSLVLLLWIVAGCSVTGHVLSISEVQPWERGALARDDMQLVTDALEQSVDDHIYFSREASTGGSSIQGGGCGCN